MTHWTRRSWLALPLVAAQAKDRVVRVATFGLTPYAMDGGANGSIQGAVVEFFERELAPRMGVQFHWLPLMTVPRLLMSLESGAADFCPLLTHSPEREAQVRYAAQSFVRFESVVAVRPEHPMARRARLVPADLVGVQVGWVQGASLPAGLELPGIRWSWVSVVNWERALLTQVERGRIEAAYFSNRATPEWHVRANRLGLVLIHLSVPARPVFAVGSRTDGPELMDRYNEVAPAAFADRRFEATLQRWQTQVA
ncbi:substrate-binding periplasmic protein [Inhella gelatinilytica]|uniref:Transporter substrate-binding domain-containing protein n=1 Tax=Inhella gelatinilytica TaxID=2795030 RepID=A0A931J044_9BURK|nr:transporter substrate-binding domain-containing protein [Inhella gelatinilytica]MBH9552961.1 transporter substrate-binding domain-containing protein [Inhella gelatinilytica]